MKPIVVVLGMGRSGTSLVCQALETMGVSFGGPLLGAHERNERGHYEHIGIQSIHGEILKCFGIDGWLFKGTLPSGWERRVSAFEERLTAVIRKEMEAAPLFGFKDQRTTRLLPLWERVFSRLGVSPKYILCLRYPHAVYSSIVSGGEVIRDGSIEAERSVMEIWAEYYHDAMTVSPLQIWYEDWRISELLQRHRISNWIECGMGCPVYEEALCHAAS